MVSSVAMCLVLFYSLDKFSMKVLSLISLFVSFVCIKCLYLSMFGRLWYVVSMYFFLSFVK